MLTLRPSRPLLVAPAGATEGTTTAPPPPWNLAAPGFGPAASAPFTSAVHRRPTIRRARIVPNRIRKGKRATLRLSLPQGGKVKYTIARMSAPHRGRVTARTVSVPSGKVSIRLPRGVHGRALAAGRYRVTAVVVDAQGGRSRTVSRSLIVRSAHR